MISTASKETQLKIGYLDNSNPTIVFTKSKSEPKIKISFDIIEIYKTGGGGGGVCEKRAESS